MIEKSDKRGRLRFWTLLATLALAAVLLFLAFRGVHWHEMLKTAREGRPQWLALAALTLTVSLSLRAVRWRILLSASRRIPMPAVFWATAIGYFGNSFLPARAGEVIRSVMIARKGRLSTSYVLATALTERILDGLALVLISFVSLSFLKASLGWLPAAVRVMAVLGVLGMLGLFVAPRTEQLIKALLARLPLPASLARRLFGLIEQFLLGMRAFQNPARALGFAGLTAAVWMSDAVVAVNVAKAFNFRLPLLQALLLLAALGLASAAPSTPGYVGIYQFVAVTVLTPLGFSRDEALVYIIAFQAVSYAVVTLWGALGFWRLRAGGPLALTREAEFDLRT